MSQTLLSKNLSHRHLIKQKTKQLFYYVPTKPSSNKSTNNLNFNLNFNANNPNGSSNKLPRSSNQLRLGVNPNFERISKNMKERERKRQRLRQEDDDTSINLDIENENINEIDSLSKCIVASDPNLIKPIHNTIVCNSKRSLQIPKKYIRPNRKTISLKYKSVQTVPQNQSSSSNMCHSISIKKLSNNFSRNSQFSKIPSMGNLHVKNLPFDKVDKISQEQIPKSQTVLGLKNISSNPYLQTHTQTQINSQQNLHNSSLRKKSASKMKLKVFDPFEKRSKLDLQFKNQSYIDKINQSMLSTLNRQEFRELINKI